MSYPWYIHRRAQKVKSILRIFPYVILLLMVGTSCTMFRIHRSHNGPIDRRLAHVLFKYLKGEKQVLGVAVVNVETGEIMASSMFERSKIHNKKNELAANLTNIVRSVTRNLDKTDYKFNFAKIEFNRGIFYVATVNPHTFVSCCVSQENNNEKIYVVSYWGKLSPMSNPFLNEWVI